MTPSGGAITGQRGRGQLTARAAVADPAVVAPTIARALGVRETGDQPAHLRLKTALRARALLLVLDNFE